ncbi:hypothetical protein NDU88_011765 [Pleurodeles waltl]|uniref:Uncharacterized protein n=1 Tax=Pleurodeles waltl TaxID=8319 RepID=A0AAV7S777_PLEWA|nr:hypothetical protein NDU88_011765 [Pleurodeles waltl]
MDGGAVGAPRALQTTDKYRGQRTSAVRRADGVSVARGARSPPLHDHGKWRRGLQRRTEPRPQLPGNLGPGTVPLPPLLAGRSG